MRLVRKLPRSAGISSSMRTRPSSMMVHNSIHIRALSNLSHPFTTNSIIADGSAEAKAVFARRSHTSSAIDSSSRALAGGSSSCLQRGRRAPYEQAASTFPFSHWSSLCLAAASLCGSIYLSSLSECEQSQAAAKDDENKVFDKDDHSAASAGHEKRGLPTFSLAEVSKHNKKETGIWVVYKAGVYDISTFVSQHPGGSKIFLAAGKSIEPFWAIYGAHNHEQVQELLEVFRIGNLAKEDRAKARPAPGSGPYSKEPERSPVLLINSETPFNAEPPPEMLAQDPITPNDLFFVRNHLPVPVVDPKSYKLTVDVGDGKAKTFTLDELKTKFKPHEVTTTIQCAGNRRREMSEGKTVKGLSWNLTAISTATWRGPLLSDVLKAAGFDPSDPACIARQRQGELAHIQFEGLDKEVDGKSYGASVPLHKLLHPNNDMVLAYEMNGQAIPRDHGFPVRAVVPGVVGARNVKWLSSVRLSPEESQSFWQQQDYRGFPPNADYSNVKPEMAGPAIIELPVQSAILEPVDGAELGEDDEEVTVKGFAWSGGGRGVVRVDVSIDGGETWHTAELEDAFEQPVGRVWAWKLWEVSVPLPDKDPPSGKLQIICKAVDDSYNSQPDTVEPIWNMRGMLNNAWHRINVNLPLTVRRIYRRPSLKAKKKTEEQQS